MKKIVLILIAFLFIISGCGQRDDKKRQAENAEEVHIAQEERVANSKTLIESQENDNAVVKTQQISKADSDDSECEDIEVEDKTEIPVLKNVDTITVDYDYFEAKTGTKNIYHFDNEYSKYGIYQISTLGMTSDDYFLYDNMDYSFSIITEIKLYDNILSLIIRGDTEHSLGVWLVNYDKNKIEEGFYKYIDSYPIGYDEWAEGASWIKSVIYLQPEPYIEQESASWEEKENSKVEILKSGKFKVIQTIHSKYEM
ncbi:MAG: hypothetical protein LBG67_04545 [Campylobacteraceae bacterium]|jgi:hypothetical protein|nr:hypothetical protein [Campylobacteraceae bacterium]